MTAQPAHVRDVDEATFEREVIERSRQVPVVVDFWAAWCGPCRMLGPVLEQLAEQSKGDFELVKVNVDENPRLSQRYRIQGIPAVKAFRDGAMVAEFTGALPEPRVRAWLNGVVPSAADRLAREGLEAEGRGDLVAAERQYRAALAADQRHAAAGIGLARVLIDQGRADDAEPLLTMLAGNPEAGRLRSRLRFRAAANGADFAALNARVAAAPRDAAARYDLGMALAGDEAYTAAFDHLLESVRLDRHYAGDAARKAMLDLFGVLGEDDPRTREYRRQLSSVLF
jgi:putative thioredoxin